MSLYVLLIFGVFTTGDIITDAQSTDIRLVREKESTDTQKGTVELKLNGVWHLVCSKGFPPWGKREAVVACKQLGFEGGWPYDLKQANTNAVAAKFIGNFECNGSEKTLLDCSYGNSLTTCLNDELAGIQCYNSFEVRLVGDIAPNGGIVEVRYDDVWSNVCYESTGGGIQWSFYNVQVICREIGFPGTLFQLHGGHGRGNRRHSVSGFKCREDMRHSSLQECFPDAPVALTNQSDYPCATGNTDERNEAVAICAVPGYLGCYDTASNSHLRNSRLQLLNNMTINICRSHCRNLDFQYAILERGDTCFCGNGTVNSLTPDGDRDCKLRCSGDNSQVCGGDMTVSVYDVTIGICDDPTNGTTVYYFGDTYIFDGFQCEPEHELVGATNVQCVLGDSPQDTKWNDDFPKCKNLSKQGSLKEKEGYDNDSVKLVYFVVPGVVATSLVAVFVMIAVIIRSRRGDPREDPDDQLQGYWTP